MSNQASEDIDNILFELIESAGSYIHKLTAAEADYIQEQAKAAIQSIIRTEKLKLLAEVRERVIEQAKPDERKATSWQQGIEVAAYEDAVRVYEYKMNERLTKLEAEL